MSTLLSFQNGNSAVNILKFTGLLCFLFAITIYNKAYAQSIYGNEWLHAGQSYAKIRISEKGIYKITYTQLQNIGFFDKSTSTVGIQIFYLGKEIPLHIIGDEDNDFNENDYILFYGNPDNGKIDSDLYKPGEQPNPEVSLFDDVASYYITNSSKNAGKRYQNLNLSSAGISPENEIIYTVSKNFSSQYYPGQYVLDVMTFSDYIEGEGYLGETFSIGTSQTHTLSTPNFNSSSTFKPVFESFVAGRSNASSTDPSGNNHHLKVSVDNLVVKDTKFKGYKTVRIAEALTTVLNQNTNVTFSSINDIGAVTDFQAPSYIRLTYPRTLNAQEVNFLEFKLNSSNTNCVLNFTNTDTWTSSFVINPASSEIYAGIKNASSTTFTVKNTSNTYTVFDASAIRATNLEVLQINLVNPNTTDAKMLIVTHPSLVESSKKIAAYKTTRGTNTSVISTEELYNQFGYGVHSAIAIRNYCRFLLEKAETKPEFLFLVGKGYEYVKQNLEDDLVPTFGFPASDIGITSKLEDDNLAPALATGRLPAKNSADVENYLEKIKIFEQQPSELWRKTIINITGGGNSGEDTQFSAYLRNLSKISDKEYFGSHTITYYKTVTDPITDNLTEKINNTIATGASLVTFLGHGSTTGTAVSVGRAKDIEKVLFYYINGCSTGNAFTSASLGEEFILEKQRGAIGWIGTSSEGVASYLSGLANAFYQKTFKTNYGQSVASNLSAGIRNYQNPTDNLNKIHCQQTIYLGDPSLSFYAPTKPDYEISPNNISMVESNATASSPSFTLSLIVKNIGKALPDSVKVEVIRTLSDNTIIKYPYQSFNNLYNTDTLHFNIPNSLANASGNNRFTIKIDPENEISELNELNNVADFSIYLASNGISIISPIPYSILSKDNLELKVQSNNLFTKTAVYLFEIDTVGTFDSNWKKTSGKISSNLFASWKPDVSLEANKVYYWRAKLDAEITDGGQWQNSSFTYIPDSEEGWIQAHHHQFSGITLKNITADFKFTNTVFPIRLSTRGQNSTTTAERRIRVGGSNASPSYNGSEFNGLAIMAIDSTNSTKILNYPSPYNFKNDGINGSGVFYFDTNNLTDVDSLVRYINNIPLNYNVFGVSGLNFAPKMLPEIAKFALKNLGLSLFESVNNGEPYVFVGKKGVPQNSGSIRELSASATEDILFLYDIPYPWSNGTYTSEKIGPAKKWYKSTVEFNISPNDIVKANVIGVKRDGIEEILKSGQMFTFDLTDVDANEYPFIKIRAEISDNVEFTAPTLNFWKTIYEGYPETSFNPQVENYFYSKQINEGDSIKIGVGISNLKEILSDSLDLYYKITKQDRSIINGKILTVSPILAKTDAKAQFSLPTLGLAGNNILQLHLIPKNQKDQFDFNNYINYDFKVIADNKNPLVDVLFDGKHIINGEVVSPNPNISVSLVDENKFLIMRDTGLVKIFLKKHDAGDYKRLFFGTNEISVQTEATTEENNMTYLVRTGLLSDGEYSLKISSRDVTGNKNEMDHVTNFTVVNEQSVTDILPYPNPVVNSARFVFKVTGAKVPDNFFIQIFNSSGKVVKEINKDELGNIKIGNNISDYVWDGTDNFGDRLANGVYFYKVTIENNDGSAIKRRYEANTSRFFKKDIGKIYLLR